MRIPEWYRIEIGHAMDRWRERLQNQSWRDRLNDNPKGVVIVTGVSLGLLLLVLYVCTREPVTPQHWSAKQAWFYDVKAEGLFLASVRQVGPIEAPSGELEDGSPAGFRAHVYSYVLNPNEDELFVGFLERPLEGKEGEVSASDMADENLWSKTRLIKRLQDEDWVRASSRKGRDILDAMSRPNRKGQTPIYQIPK